jgi:hypothetical protein
MSEKLTKLVQDLEDENKKLKEQVEKAITFEYGDKAKKSMIQVRKKDKMWILVDQHGYFFTKRDTFSYQDCFNAKEFKLEDALKKAKEVAEKREKK